ncbi:putative G-protein coupled receptor 141 [Acipenser oxyrinchus oxyrinchus]|uniref:G-protein coupled receptor 141 n=1 Tax=Acipenser oxyrinchus oxyrinchus TaxID=40147 RepID=A0AAD8LQ04_ACIOX|nr:putative G-protein coupled receptor 141 [Acipenser oxyrinchus oxyrinchus]
MYINNGTNETREDMIQMNSSISQYNYALVTIYSVSLIGGVVGVIFMTVFLYNSSTKLSVTTTSIINLVLVHSVFLISVPFRIEYFATNEWKHPFFLCKWVSIFIHSHLYISFIFYIAILLVRFLFFFGKNIHFYRPLHAFFASCLVWVVVFVSIFPPLFIQYGKHGNYSTNKCFEFGKEMQNPFVASLNYVIITTVLLTVFALLACQLVILVKVAMKNKTDLLSRQEFRAQLKNLSFLMVMIICFLPYHIFRIYYIQHNQDDDYTNYYNEICLAITSLCCFDLLTFIARGS